jgi:dipeptidyl aminopeptidase/acylaminoacyl peptidase
MITYETRRLFTYSTDELITRPIRGIVLDLMGLGDQRMFDAPTERGKALAQKGIVLLIPYNDPWAWMNARAVANTDAIVRALMRRYALAEDIPIVSSGGSMGGLAALVYTRYAALQPVACVANCPVCDLPYHYTERPDLPRTLRSAFPADDEAAFTALLERHSPLHLANEMPDVSYTIFHCTADQAVNKELHSDRFVEAMRPAHRVDYYAVADRDHCDLTEEAKQQYNEAIERAILSDREA